MCQKNIWKNRPTYTFNRPIFVLFVLYILIFFISRCLIAICVGYVKQMMYIIDFVLGNIKSVPGHRNLHCSYNNIYIVTDFSGICLLIYSEMGTYIPRGIIKINTTSICCFHWDHYVAPQIDDKTFSQLVSSGVKKLTVPVILTLAGFYLCLAQHQCGQCIFTGLVSVYTGAVPDLHLTDPSLIWAIPVFLLWKESNGVWS